jgi:hypothetical protein
VYYKAVGNASERNWKLQKINNVSSFYKAFATMLKFYLIARNSNSKDL